MREGEIVAGPLVGWNFGEGHLHNEQLLAAVQRRCQFDDGDVRVIILEGQPIHVQKQWYRIVDAKTGVIEEGYVDVEDMLTRQPWPEPDDEYPVHVTTQRDRRPMTPRWSSVPAPTVWPPRSTLPVTVSTCRCWRLATRSAGERARVN